ncbi:MAG: pilus assembly protein PilY [Proteobacteria bacterium]|nr:pilus assembly protein PilY [Pseudomonadota bacterium]
MKLMSSRTLLLTSTLVVLAGLSGSGPLPIALAGGAPPPLAISQVPLTITTAGRPQVVFAIGNSQSMDGTLSGAIMTGSGSLTGGDASMANSSSPVNFSVPSGFTTPVNGIAGPATDAITVNSGGNLVDNSDSRLNVAKAGIQAIVATYAQNTDFALISYKGNAGNPYTTWLYQMSGPGGFQFSNDNSTHPVGQKWVTNPCYQYTTASANVKNYCTSIAAQYAPGVLGSNQYMLVAKSSDDASVNDVLYAGGGLATVFLDYGAVTPASPFPPSYTLTNYNNGGITVTYANTTPNGIRQTGPTNAGYVPYSPQVMYEKRGFGYYGSADGTSGQTTVAMQSAGVSPTPASVAAVINAFAPALAPETNNGGTSELKSWSVQSPTGGLMAYAKTYLSTVTKPSCSQQYVILISDGLPTQDKANKNWPPLGSDSGTGYGVTATFNGDGSLGTTNDQALTDAVNSIAALNSAGIKTYVIGLGAGVAPTVNPQAAATLKAMAVAGGTANYFPAYSSTALVNDLNSILISIQGANLSSTAIAVNSGSLNTNSQVYQASFNTSDTPYSDWTGDIDAYTINSSGAIATSPSWSTKTQLNSQVAGGGWNTGRYIATWNPAGGGSGAGIPFRWASLNATQQGQLAQPGDPAVTPPTLSNAQLRVQYLRGDTSQEVRNGGAFRNRSGILGDIVDSNPIYVGQPMGPYQDASYLSFMQTYATTPRPNVLYTGANDGMLHAIDPTTGNEKFAFVPNAVFGNLANLASPLYNSSHQYFVDGAPQVNDVLFGSDGKWHTLLVGGENAGGNSIYALDVTNPQNLSSEATLANAVKWEFSDADMGLSFSAPSIVRTAANPVVDSSSSATVAGFAVMFGNGYNSASGMPIFYAVKPESGAVIAKINLCTAPGVPATACNAALPNGLSTIVAANSSGVLGFPVDEVYAGDLQGNMWAIDVGASNPALWKVRLLFQARDSGGNPQPITVPPVLTLNPNFPSSLGLMVFFGTGQLLQSFDLTNTNTQSFYGVWDNGSATTRTRSSLQQQTITTVPSSVTGFPNDIRTTSNNTVNWSSQYGWYYDLPLSGERVISPAVVENGGIIFDTYTPSKGLCSIGGVSWLMDVAYANGGQFSKPELDVNGSGNLNSSAQQYLGQNPVGMSMGTIYVPTPSIIRANLSNGVGAIKVVSKTSSKGTPGVGTVKERGHQPTRSGWWQIK